MQLWLAQAAEEGHGIDHIEELVLVPMQRMRVLVMVMVVSRLIMLLECHGHGR